MCAILAATWVEIVETQAGAGLLINTRRKGTRARRLERQKLAAAAVEPEPNVVSIEKVENLDEARTLIFGCGETVTCRENFADDGF